VSLPIPTHDPDDLRRAADDVLARAEFRAHEPDLLERLRTWVGDRLQDLFDAAFSGSTGSIVAWLILAGAVVAAVWFATRFGRTVQPERRVGVVVEEVHRRSPADWRAEAEAQEAAGEWKLALRSRYRALVGELIAEGVLEDVAGRTTGEYRADVAAQAPERSAAFGAATDLFERVWYADDPTGPAENAEFRAHAETVVGVAA
jgi:Domain of unknown function (DUF4129)